MSLERGGFVSFGGWLLVGAVVTFFGLSMSAVGLPVLLLASGFAAWWSWRSALPGLLVGASMPLLWVASNNRGGPGLVTYAPREGVQGGAELLDPTPWLIAGLGLVVAAAILLALGLRLRRTR